MNGTKNVQVLMKIKVRKEPKYVPLLGRAVLGKWESHWPT